MACKTTLTAEDLPDNLAPLRSAIERAVPHGRSPGARDPGAWGKVPGSVDTAWVQLEPDFTELCRDHPKLAKTNNRVHLGTLGTGNHFIEVCLDEAGFVWFMLHSGSRGVGNAIGTMFIELAKQDALRSNDEAQRAIERALSLSPNLLVVQFCAGNIRTILGDGDRALGHFERAMRIGPLDPGTSGFIAGTGAAHLVAGRYDEALAAVQRSIQDSSTFVLSHVVMLSALGHLGRIDEAKLSAQRPLELSPEFTVSRYQSPSPVKDPEFRKPNAAIFRAAGVSR